MTRDTVEWALYGVLIGALGSMTTLLVDRRRRPGRAWPDFLWSMGAGLPGWATLFVVGRLWQAHRWSELPIWLFALSGWILLGQVLYAIYLTFILRRSAYGRDAARLLVVEITVRLGLTVALYLLLVYWLAGQRAAVSVNLLAAHAGAALCGVTWQSGREGSRLSGP